MDSLTHGAAGIFVGWAWPRRWAVPNAVVISATAALLPDLDVFLPGHFNPDAVLAHRGFTHSFFGVAVLAPLLAILPWWLSKQKGTYWKFAGLIAMGMISHLALDLPTEPALKIFWPFYAKHVYVDWLSGIDLTLFSIALSVLVAAWVYAKPGEALRRGAFSAAFMVVFCWWLFAGWPLIGGRFGSSLQTEEPVRTIYPLVLAAMLLVQLIAIGQARWSFHDHHERFGLLGLGAFALYLCACGSAHWAAVKRIDNFTQVRGIKVLARTANRFEPSSFLAPDRWTGLVLAPEGVYEAEMSTLGSEPPKFRLYPNAVENAFVAKARAIPAVQQYLTDTRFPVSCYEQQEGRSLVEFYDPWWGVGVVRVMLTQQRDIKSVRWVSVAEYVSTPPFSAFATSSAQNVGPQQQSGPCFLVNVQQAN